MCMCERMKDRKRIKPHAVLLLYCTCNHVIVNSNKQQQIMFFLIYFFAIHLTPKKPL